MKHFLLSLMVWLAALYPCTAQTPFSGTLLLGSALDTDTGKALLLSNSITQVSGSADNYISLGTSLLRTTSINSFIFPIAATIKSLRFTAHTQPAVTKSYTATILVNGSSTAATCTVTSILAVCSWQGSISVNPGDTAVILTHPSVIAPTASIVSASVGYTPTTANDTIIPSWTGGGFNDTIPSYTAGFNTTTPSINNTLLELEPFPDGGTIDRLYIMAAAPGTGGSGKSFAYNVTKNGVATTLTTTISNASTTGNDTTHSFSVAADTDFIQFSNTPTSTPTAGQTVYGVRYVPTTAAHYMFGFNENTNPSTSAQSFYSLTMGNNPNGTEAEMKNISSSQTFKRLTVKFKTAPGLAASGKKWTVAVRVNGVNSAISCDVLEIAKVCTSSGSVAVNDNDFVVISVTPTGTPASSTFGMGLLATR